MNAYITTECTLSKHSREEGRKALKYVIRGIPHPHQFGSKIFSCTSLGRPLLL